MAEKNKLVDDINFYSFLQLVEWIRNAFQHGSLGQLGKTVFIRSPSIAALWDIQAAYFTYQNHAYSEGRKLKLLGMDEKIENFDPETWRCKLNVDISWFKVILNDVILIRPPCGAWPQRDAFLTGTAASTQGALTFQTESQHRSHFTIVHTQTQTMIYNSWILDKQ